MENLQELNNEIISRLIFGYLDTLNFAEEVEVEVETQDAETGETIVTNKFELKETRGLFLPFDQATFVGFKNELANWETVSHAGIEGYYSNAAKLVILQRSAVEVYEKKANGELSFLDNATDSKNNLTKSFELAQQDESNFDIFSRVLIFLVDEHNTLLHDLPLCLKLGKGASGNFAAALRNFYFTCVRLFFAAQNKPMQWLSQKALSHFIFEFSVGQDDYGFLTPTQYTLPTLANLQEYVILNEYLDAYYDISGGFLSQKEDSTSTNSSTQFEKYGIIGL